MTESASGQPAEADVEAAMKERNELHEQIQAALDETDALIERAKNLSEGSEASS